MATARSSGKSKGVEKNNALLFRFRGHDTSFGVTRRTASTLANHLGMSETQVLHVALAKMAREQLPAYEQDDGPLSDKVIKAIKRRVPQGNFRPTRTLFDGA